MSSEDRYLEDVYAEEDEDDSFDGPDMEVEEDEEEADMDVEQDAEVETERAAASETVTVTLSDLMNAINGGQTTGLLARLSLTDIARLARAFGIVPVSGTGVQTYSSTTRDDNEEDEDAQPRRSSRLAGQPARPPQRQLFEPHKEPQEAGLGLLHSGEFGSVKTHIQLSQGKRNIAHALRQREMAPRPVSREALARCLVPNSNGTVVAQFDANVYSGQFSEDSKFFYTCCQDFRLHIYSTEHMEYRHRSRSTSGQDHQSTMKTVRVFRGVSDGWTVTDSHLSPDNERLLYASMSPTVYMVKTGLGPGWDGSVDLGRETQIPLHFSDPASSRRLWAYEEGFAIWSCRFSADGNEVVAGGSGKLFVYDLIANRRTVKISAHDDDVNSCCWADASSGNVLISASDDSFLKVWDRRSLASSPKPSGVLIGHTEGITYVSPKGDGRYVISNGKDQALRLWDLRMMKSYSDYEAASRNYYGDRHFDYRYGALPNLKHRDHPQDCSVMAFRGHQVLRTLIRCHFSPVETTGQSYIYSGSYDGRIHIWSLDGRVVEILDRGQTLPMSFDPSGPDPGEAIRRDTGRPTRLGRAAPGICVRDVSWHSRLPIIISSAWQGQVSQSNIAQHEWKGLTKNARTMRSHLEAVAEKNRVEVTERKRKLPGSFASDDWDE